MQQMSGRPAVSIILPAFNAADYLEATIRSALAQTFTDFELLLLDNASTDDTPAVAATFSDPRLKYRRNPTNIGFAGNVELGRSLANATYTVVFNADDIWEPTYLAKAVALLEANPGLAFMHAHITLIDENGRGFGDAVTQWRPSTPGQEAFLNCFNAGFSSPTMLMRSGILRSVPPLPTGEPWGAFADTWLFLQLCLRGDVGFIAEPLMRYRVHPTSMMSESYANGSFLLNCFATVNDAFTWPEVQKWASAEDRWRVTQISPSRQQPSCPSSAAFIRDGCSCAHLRGYFERFRNDASRPAVGAFSLRVAATPHDRHPACLQASPLGRAQSRSLAVVTRHIRTARRQVPNCPS